MYYGWTINFTNEFLYSLQTLFTFCLAIFEKSRALFFGIVKLSRLFSFTVYVNITRILRSIHTRRQVAAYIVRSPRLSIVLRTVTRTTKLRFDSRLSGICILTIYVTIEYLVCIFYNNVDLTFRGNHLHQISAHKCYQLDFKLLTCFYWSSFQTGVVKAKPN